MTNNYDISKLDDVRRSFWHYTTFNSLEKILSNKTFRLSKIYDQNDINEIERLKAKSKNLYSISFCNTQAERVSMWILYSGLNEGVSIGIRPSIMKQLLVNNKIIGITNTEKEIALKKKDMVIKYDWIYYKTKTKGKYKYRNKYYIIEKNNNIEFIKDYPWEYEQEFRIVIEIKNKNYINKFKCLYIKFDESLIKDLYIKFSSSVIKSIDNKKTELINIYGISANNIQKSEIKYNFDLNKKNIQYIESDLTKSINRKDLL